VTQWRITEYHGTAGLAQLEQEWRGLVANMPGGRAHHTWEAASAYARHLMVPGESMLYLAMRDDACLRAVMPLRQGADHVLGVPLRVLSAPWGGEWPFGDPVCPEDEACEALLPVVVEHLRQSPRTPRLLAVGPADATSKLWKGAALVRPMISYEEGGSNRIECSGEYDEYHSALSKNFRNNLRKARNKLAKLDDVRRISVRDPVDVERELSAFVALEGSGWKGSTKDGDAICRHPRNVAFYREMLTALAESGRAEINALYAAERCIASQLCVRGADSYDVYKIAYDEAFAPQAPGQLLFEDTLKRCFADPTLAQVDLISDAQWHGDWRPIRTALCRSYFSVGGLGGRLLMPAVRFRFGPLRRVVRALRRGRVTR